MFKLEKDSFFSDGVIDLSVVFTYDGHEDKGTVPFYGCRLCLGGTRTKVGTISLRFNIENNLESYYDGNIGYYIKDEFRGKGFAVRGCILASNIAKIEGMNELIINCCDKNSSSIRVIEKLGAELVEIINVPDEFLDEHDTSSKRLSYLWKFSKEYK